MTVFVKRLAITLATNEALNRVFNLTQNRAPIDLTGASFSSAAKDLNGEVITDIVVQIASPSTAGVISLQIDEEVMDALDPVEGFYDIVMTLPGGKPDNLWQAPFRIVEGAAP